jgi:predicted nucleotidyltransferase
MTTATPKPLVDPERFAAFAEAWKRRARRRDEEDGRRSEEALGEARRAARILAERYSVTRVTLFGSLAWPRAFRSDSDIDLAVEGLAPEHFFRADAELAREIAFPIDLKLLSDCPPGLRERIELEGIALHGE